MMKEINYLLTSLKGYLSILIFLISSGFFLWIFPDTSILNHSYADMKVMFFVSPYILIFICSSLTMNLWVYEKNSGMLENLSTMPLNTIELILGKYLASVLILSISMIFSLIYFFSILYLANPIGNVETYSILSSYFGLFLLGSTFISIGVFGSSFFENQFVSFTINMALCLFFYLGFEFIAKYYFESNLCYFLSTLGGYKHFISLKSGLIDSKDIVYFFTIIFGFLFTTKMRLKINN